MGLMNYLQGRNRDSDMQNRLVVIAGEGQGGISRESSPQTYTLPYVLPVGSCGKQRELNPLTLTLTYRGGMGWVVGERFKKEGTYIYLWLIHIVVCQKPTHYNYSSIKNKILRIWMEKRKRRKHTKMLMVIML